MYARGTHDIVDRRELLRIKVKSLAEEARIIRHQERKLKYRKHPGVKGASLAIAVHSDGTTTNLKDPSLIRRPHGPGPLHTELSHHRRVILRRAARHAHIALGLIRGLPYARIECKVLPGNAPNWIEVYKLFLRYGPASISRVILPGCFPSDVQETHTKLIAKGVTMKVAA